MSATLEPLVGPLLKDESARQRLRDAVAPELCCKLRAFWTSPDKMQSYISTTRNRCQYEMYLRKGSHSLRPVKDTEGWDSRAYTKLETLDIARIEFPPHGQNCGILTAVLSYIRYELLIEHPHMALPSYRRAALPEYTNAIYVENVVSSRLVDFLCRFGFIPVTVEGEVGGRTTNLVYVFQQPLRHR